MLRSSVEGARLDLNLVSLPLPGSDEAPELSRRARDGEFIDVRGTKCRRMTPAWGTASWEVFWRLAIRSVASPGTMRGAVILGAVLDTVAGNGLGAK